MKFKRRKQPKNIKNILKISKNLSFRPCSKVIGSAKGRIIVNATANAFVRRVRRSDTFVLDARWTRRNALVHTYVTMGEHMPILKVPLPMGELDSNLIYGSSDQYESAPKWLLDRFSVSHPFAMCPTNRQTRRPRYVRHLKR